jgi:hypothetical protein
MPEDRLAAISTSGFVGSCLSSLMRVPKPPARITLHGEPAGFDASPSRMTLLRSLPVAGN